MPDSLIIVESPTKVKTIKKYLGSNFEVKASVGHVKDLPKSTLGIDIENHFEPTYEVIKEKKKVISELRKTAKTVDNIYLATDPDREGEAIAWHIVEEIGAGNKKIHRVLFNDLTKKTILAAVKNPQVMNNNKYEAQQTRRLLDRLVGYQISPILWDKVRRGLSAGRVQSVAVRMICDREKEIDAFVAEEFWNITALLQSKNPPPFEARLFKVDGKKKKISNETQAKEILNDISTYSFIVSSIDKKESKRSPAPPFTTSKLQQEASRKLRFSAKKTMGIAQKLYEGIDLGKEGSVGLITYMRTDSVRVAKEVIDEAREYIVGHFGKDYIPANARNFKTSKTAQDAHEAIRPASMYYEPIRIKEFLTNDQFRLYQLIWKRFVASQMEKAVFDLTTIDISAGQYTFRAQGSVMKFPGFTSVYTESSEENKESNGNDATLPEVYEKETLSLISLDPKQNFTQPPPRFSEATLVKELEEKGIGRPSTYAAILSTIQDRTYVRLDSGKFHPTELGTIVNDLLVESFEDVLDVEFTASLENKLDLIEDGKLNRYDILKDFYAPFEIDLKKAKKEMRNIKREEKETDIVCEKCGNKMVVKWGRNGRFIACSNYPECRNTSNFTEEANGDINKVKGELTDVVCEKCGNNMIIKEGRFGRFLGCSTYPECKHTQTITTGVSCPEPDCDGYLTERRSKKGKTFFGCSNYPDCSYALWDRPVPEECPQCHAPFLVEKYQRGKGSIKICIHKDCGYKEND
ncbi:MAG: type I DNA topoisomerase [Deltaproteobacteria bacterium]|nr:type I DNA topoisomerase [Deltaproteobacteria bacterium]